MCHPAPPPLVPQFDDLEALLCGMETRVRALALGRAPPAALCCTTSCPFF